MKFNVIFNNIKTNVFVASEEAEIQTIKEDMISEIQGTVGEEFTNIIAEDLMNPEEPEKVFEDVYEVT